MQRIRMPRAISERDHMVCRFSIVVSAILAGVWIVASDVRAQTGWETPEFADATAAFDRGDCRGAWEAVWPLAKSGNPDARLYVLYLVMFSTNPPGLDVISSPRALWERHLLTLSAYAALSRRSGGKGEPSHKWIRDDVPRLIGGLGLGTNGDKVAKCYQSGGTFRDCLDLAVSLGVIPRFEDYAEEVERAERDTGVAASCRHPREPLPQKR